MHIQINIPKHNSSAILTQRYSKRALSRKKTRYKPMFFIFFPFPCPIAYNLGRKQPFLPVHNSTEFPAHHCWHHLGLSFELERRLCHWGWKRQFATVRYTRAHSWKNTLKYRSYSQWTTSDLLCSLLMITASCIVYTDTHIWDSHHPWSLHTDFSKWNPGYQQVSSILQPLFPMLRDWLYSSPTSKIITCKLFQLEPQSSTARRRANPPSLGSTNH